MSPPCVSICATIVSVLTCTCSRGPLAAGAATAGAAGLLAEGAPVGALGVGTAAIPCVVASIATGGGRVSFCHASQRRSNEKENTTKRIRRCVSIYSLGNGVVTAGVPGMAPRKTPDGEPASAQRAVALECLQRVGRARGVKTAVHAQ